ncbi:exodeoxyribonuclease VII large subunit [Lacticaseibacillus chiayiensis]|uniref:exodeoxyribonuclease VII large subunit n=1 Tax=Lacticaseibacillus chiayiensis TaxID=2100821 RepID=UPI0010102945|nr:exodeoxyribonuclease VII large subunit [Lacticaseibacillus chiayiensis]RXT59261.1 exodeoxyribonuclease VII large subunit [Lacticaseibacillus chiayiensis]
MVDSDQYLSVTALTQYLKRKFDADPYLAKVYLTGEISNYRKRVGNQYFSLKDDHAKIGALMFRNAFSKLQFNLEEGMKVLAVGRVSLYEPSGEYRLIVERLEPDGVGALYQAFEQLKKKLASEGLFDRNKRPLPLFPKRVAVVTSPSGAVIQDIMTTVARRYPILQLTLFPAVVQGDQAADSIVKQLNRIKAMSGFDAVIIGRGGGSIEDLWPFNEEKVARALVDMPIPIVSSVGHETDTTITDFIADRRAATPTAAAEIVTPVTLVDSLNRISEDRVRLVNAMHNRLQNAASRLQRSAESVVLTQPDRLYDQYVQRVDQLRQRLNQIMVNQLRENDHRLAMATQQLDGRQLLIKVVNLKRQLVDDLHRLDRAVVSVVKVKRQAVANAALGLDHLSPLKILGRGFAYVTDDAGQMLKKTSDYAVDADIHIHVADGQIGARVIAKEKKHG